MLKSSAEPEVLFEHEDMSDAFHEPPGRGARRQRGITRVGKHFGALYGIMPNARKADIDGLRREFGIVHQELEALHDQDMEHRLDQSAQRSWRARVRRLTVRVDGLADGATSESALNLAPAIRTITN